MLYRSLLGCAALLPLLSQAAEPHVHGNATLFIAIEQQRILLEMESPAANILGFEHAPSTTAQKKKLKDSIATLSQYSNLIQFSNISCQQISDDVEAPFGKNNDTDHNDDSHHNKQDHAEHPTKDHSNEHSHEHEKQGSEHSDFHVHYVLECDAPLTNQSATITAFSAFKGFEKIKVNWLTDKQQGSQTLTPTDTRLNFK
ncbi:MAG: hypothetical protein ACI9NY_000727 [Kiritimatiellia bacterium]|jgi:hypothetical protein